MTKENGVHGRANRNGQSPRSGRSPWRSTERSEVNGATGTNGTNGVGHGPGVEPLDLPALFDGVRLLLIGGTGFLGKIFWLMLLDRLPQIGKIFLLVRSSKTQSSDDRFWGTI